jgi:undecaprenyl-diphosphatase
MRACFVPILHILVLSIIQGATEFLPISSSGHLILVPFLTGWADQGLAIDVAAHLGTLLAVLVYFWRDVWRMLIGLRRLLRGRLDDGGRLMLFLLAATVPALAGGFLVDKYFSDALRNPQIVAWTLIGFGLVLYLADRIGMTVNEVKHMSLAQALVIGLAQVLAFIPGTSRSGITMTAARLLGFQRGEAARFSFLLSIPAISAAGLWKGRELITGSDAAMLESAALTLAFSAIVGFLAIAFLMAWLRRAGFAPFVVYRVLLGGLLLWLIYSGHLAAAPAP